MKDLIKISIILIVLVLVTHSGCDEYVGNVNCDECYDYEPDSADLIIELTDNFSDGIPLVIYNGKIEDDSIEWIDTAWSSTYYLYVAVDRYYSVKAEYNIGNKRIIAVDGDHIWSKHVSAEDCGYECWIITKGLLKAELKYEDFE